MPDSWVIQSDAGSTAALQRRGKQLHRRHRHVTHRGDPPLTRCGSSPYAWRRGWWPPACGAGRRTARRTPTHGSGHRRTPPSAPGRSGPGQAPPARRQVALHAADQLEPWYRLCHAPALGLELACGTTAGRTTAKAVELAHRLQARDSGFDLPPISNIGERADSSTSPAGPGCRRATADRCLARPTAAARIDDHRAA